MSPLFISPEGQADKSMGTNQPWSTSPSASATLSPAKHPTSGLGTPSFPFNVCARLPEPAYRSLPLRLTRHALPPHPSHVGAS